MTPAPHRIHQISFQQSFASTTQPLSLTPSYLVPWVGLAPHHLSQAMRHIHPSMPASQPASPMGIVYFNRLASHSSVSF